MRPLEPGCQSNHCHSDTRDGVRAGDVQDWTDRKTDEHTFRMMVMASKAVPLIIAGGGAIMLWSAIEGKSWSSVLRNVISGKSPASAPNVNAVTTSAAPLASTPAGSSSISATGQTPVANTGSNQAILQATAAKFGWTSANGQWQCLYNVEMREAGFNLTATNPSSGAYGMAQFINGPSEYAQYGGDSTTAAGQSLAMCNYIEQRYGNPCNAWAHEQANGWY
jgi:hypothetical protein